MPITAACPWLSWLAGTHCGSAPQQMSIHLAHVLSPMQASLAHHVCADASCKSSGSYLASNVPHIAWCMGEEGRGIPAAAGRESDQRLGMVPKNNCPPQQRALAVGHRLACTDEGGSYLELTPMSFSMSKYWVTIIISCPSQTVRSGTSLRPAPDLMQCKSVFCNSIRQVWELIAQGCLHQAVRKQEAIQQHGRSGTRDAGLTMTSREVTSPTSRSKVRTLSLSPLTMACSCRAVSMLQAGYMHVCGPGTEQASTVSSSHLPG